MFGLLAPNILISAEAATRSGHATEQSQKRPTHGKQSSDKIFFYFYFAYNRVSNGPLWLICIELEYEWPKLVCADEI